MEPGWARSIADLSDRVALVTGASRGVGRGIARALGAAGATVYVTGRTSAGNVADVPLPGSIEATADEVTAAGGHGHAVRCDHRDDDQVRAAVGSVLLEAGCIDILVNNAWAGYQGLQRGEGHFEDPFWTLPVRHWDTMFEVGVRSHYVTSVLVAGSMVSRRSGLIVNISYYAAASYHFNTAYGVAKAAVDRLSADMAHELEPYNIASVALWPGTVKTEMNVESGQDLRHAETPEFVGMAVVALDGDPEIMAKSGRAFPTRELARAYGYRDLDGSLPPVDRGI
ncbi:MAG: SDR family NAD(P)-dependent oxidoreductase [Trebonia sp.]